MFPSLVNLNHQLVSAFVLVVDPVLARSNTALVDKLVDVITFHVSESTSYLRPKSSYASILSNKSVSNDVENDVVKFGMIELITDPCGTTLLSVIGPTPDSKLPVPPLAPSPTTAPILAHDLSSALSVPEVTNVPFKNFLVSGEVNLINAPALANFMFDVAKSPVTNAPPEVKYPVLVLVEVVVEFHVADNVLVDLVAYFR